MALLDARSLPLHACQSKNAAGVLTLLPHICNSGRPEGEALAKSEPSSQAAPELKVFRSDAAPAGRSRRRALPWQHDM